MVDLKDLKPHLLRLFVGKGEMSKLMDARKQLQKEVRRTGVKIRRWWFELVWGRKGGGTSRPIDQRGKGDDQQIEIIET